MTDLATGKRARVFPGQLPGVSLVTRTEAPPTPAARSRRERRRRPALAWAGWFSTAAASPDDLDGGRYPLHGRELSEERDARAFQGLAEHKCELDLHARHDETLDRDVTTCIEEHVVQQRGVVGLGDLAGELHRPRGQADLATPDAAPIGELALHPGRPPGLRRPAPSNRSGASWPAALRSVGVRPG